MKLWKILLFGLIWAGQSHADFVAHEWGTFTSVIGSNGISVDGMIQEDEHLPEFVYNFGDDDWPSAVGPQPFEPTLTFPNSGSRRCPRFTKVPCEYLRNQAITQKMETPVVYFYSDQPQRVRFEVDFPGGIISQSYPAPLRTLPQAIPGVELKQGYAGYEFDILPLDTPAQPPSVDPDNIYAHARNTGSHLIRSAGEVEKFIFYRGIGDFAPELKVVSEGRSMSLRNSSKAAIAQVFAVITTADGRGNLRSLGSIQAGEGIEVSEAEMSQLEQVQERGQFLVQARRHLLDALVQAGLYRDEATAMIDTWENGYFQTPGLRLLYILPESEVEEILPARITPPPREFKRVFVGRLEVMLESQELALLERIVQLGEDYPVRSLGGLALPKLLRAREVAEKRGILAPALSKVFAELIDKL